MCKPTPQGLHLGWSRVFCWFFFFFGWAQFHLICKTFQSAAPVDCTVSCVWRQFCSPKGKNKNLYIVSESCGASWLWWLLDAWDEQVQGFLAPQGHVLSSQPGTMGNLRVKKYNLSLAESPVPLSQSRGNTVFFFSSGPLGIRPCLPWCCGMEMKRDASAIS